MTPTQVQTASTADSNAPTNVTWLEPMPRTCAIEDEPRWRACPAGFGEASEPPRVIGSRWRSLEPRVREVSAETRADSHVAAIVLRNENVLFSVSGRTVHDGVVTAGALHVTEPSAATRCVFRGPYDVLHLHIPNALIAEICRDFSGREVAGFSFQPALMRDATTERLARALLAAERIGGSYGQLYADNVGIAVVTRLLSLQQAAAPERPKVAELAKWRLKRAIEFIESSLSRSVSLADIASAAGLTRMHFAAQFKVATGLRPHEYLLRRRIERAQEKLAGTSMSLVDVALSVGFQTQSHFTSVFTRLVGSPPRAWRLAQEHTPACDLKKRRASRESALGRRAYAASLATSA